MPTDDDRATTHHLRRLGVNPITVARLREFAEMDAMTLRELVAFILTDYRPPLDILEQWRSSRV